MARSRMKASSTDHNPGDLVQIMKKVQGQGDIGIVLDFVEGRRNDLVRVMFHDGLRNVHVTNLQKPDKNLG